MTNCHTWFGEGGGSCRWLHRGSNESCLVPPVLELGVGAGWLDEMRCCDDLCRDGLMIVLRHMHHDVMLSWSDFHLLSVCLLPSDWRFFCGLAFPCLSTTKVLPPNKHSGQLLGSHLEPVTCFFGHPLIEVLAVQLQPNRCC